MNSFLVCRHGGLIEPLDSGQDLIYEEEPVMEETNDENNILGLISGILEPFSNMGNISYVGKKISNVLDTKFEIIQKEDYYIIKDSREKRKEIEDFNKIKGTRYKIGSDKFKEAGLDKYLPKGQRSKNGSKKLMIIGRVQIDGNTGTIYDYAACLYPEGNLSLNHTFLFNNEDIDTIIFDGYKDEEETKFLNFLIKELSNE